MSENINQEIYTELANRIYDLDGGNIAPSIYYGLSLQSPWFFSWTYLYRKP